MCGIAGVLNLRPEGPAVEADLMRRMLAMLRHRGPDGFGIYRDDTIALGNARLSIIDLEGGWQPIGNEDETLWIVFNGEIFNYVELRPGLERRGHQFSTNSDTEVVLHLYEDHGPACLNYLNGQFVIAIWDAVARRLFLARDRLGVRPLFYTVADGQLVFGSEIKSILMHPGIRAEIDPGALAQVFTYWSPLSPRTVFQGIQELRPAHYMLVEDGQLASVRYWALDFSEKTPAKRAESYLEEFESLLIDAVRIRLRSDVPVGAYLSGGLDSSVTAAMIRRHTGNHLDTFSIAFDDPAYDESDFQQQMATRLGAEHHVVQCSHVDIGRVFPEVVWHTESPITRTAPAPMYLLSRLVSEHHFKVVVTGEGADEFLAGYDIFKEMKVRRFWARQPDSRFRPLLLRRLYPDIRDLGSTGQAYLAAFFKRGLNETQSPYYSHAIRWWNTGRTRRFLKRDGDSALPPLPPGFSNWSTLAQAQYLEIVTFLSTYLLSSQGDRMGMAHSVEGRFPFLDHRLIEFCNHLPPVAKLNGLTEKWLLKQLGRRMVPEGIWRRPKRPYRAPIHRSFFGDAQVPEYVPALLSVEALRETGLFNVEAVGHLVRKAQAGTHLSEVEDMALAGVLSTQLVHEQFVSGKRITAQAGVDCVKIVDRVTDHDGLAVESGVRQGLTHEAS